MHTYNPSTGQEGDELKASLGYRARLCLNGGKTQQKEYRVLEALREGLLHGS